jgi:hypothetical protein
MMSVVWTSGASTQSPARVYSSYCGDYTFDGARLVTKLDDASARLRKLPLPRRVLIAADWPAVAGFSSLASRALARARDTDGKGGSVPLNSRRNSVLHCRYHPKPTENLIFGRLREFPLLRRVS